MAKEPVKFHAKKNTETSPITYANRIENLRKNFDLTKATFYKHGWNPEPDYRKFLRLKERTAVSDDCVPVNNNLVQSTLGQTLNSQESLAIQNAIEGMQAKEFIQLFLDAYMSPIGSDIKWRLGEVTATKVFNCDVSNGTVIYDDDEDNLDALAVYDKYGRLDTVSNFRNKTEISSFGYIKRRTEYYTNWFFPPFSNKAFLPETYSSSNINSKSSPKPKKLNYDENLIISKRKWVEVKNLPKKTCPDCGKKVDHWCYHQNNEFVNLTYDTYNLLSLRPNPTYRKVAYKSINDNISYLQYLFEQTTGIVSTYLTEWDISLYIQEGFLNENFERAPNVLSLLNRIIKDNPSGYRSSAAFGYGLFNAAISKTPLGCPTPNTSEFNPSVYPLSTYWWPYKSIDRGDGLDRFYLETYSAFNVGGLFYGNNITHSSFREKLKWHDGAGAAYSGWYNWDTMYNWQAFYTWADDGFSEIDVIHLSEDVNESTWNDTIVDGEVSVGTISQIIDALYTNDESLGFPAETWIERTGFDDDKDKTLHWTVEKHFRMNHSTCKGDLEYVVKTSSKTGDMFRFGPNQDIKGPGEPVSKGINDVSIGGAGDISIMGVSIPGSSLLKLFLKKSSIKSQAMGIADKQKNSPVGDVNSLFSSGGSSNTAGGGSSSTSGGNNPNSNNNNKSGMFANSEDTGKYARHDGVSQWSPFLYGGPHGRFYSPNTIEGYTEYDNEFYVNIPRAYCMSVGDANNLKRDNFDYFGDFSNVYARNDLYKGRATVHPNPSRSVITDLKFLRQGRCNSKIQRVWTELRKNVDVYKETCTHYSVSRDYYNNYYYSSWSHTYYPTYMNGKYLYYDYRVYNSYYPNKLSYISPYSQVDMEYNRCPCVYNNGWHEWNNYYSYTRNGNYYAKSFYGYTGGNWHQHEERPRKICNHGNLPIYQLVRYQPKECWRAHYYTNEWVEYKRPLMHSNIDDFWTINKTQKNTIRTIVHITPVWRNWWEPVFWWLGLRSSFTARYSYIQNPPEDVYRLNFPYSWFSTANNCIQLNGANYPMYRTYAEQDFMDNVLGNGDGTFTPQNVFFCVSKEKNEWRRNKYGPEMIAEINCYVDTYQYKYRYQHWYPYGHRCHVDWSWYWDEAVATGYFIRCNMDNRYKKVYSAFGEGYSNLFWTRLLSENKSEPYQDTPPDYYKVDAVASPLTEGWIENKSYRESSWFAGYPKVSNETGFFGWGYVTTFPSLTRGFTIQSDFEDANAYLQMTRRYGHWVTDLTFDALKNYFNWFHIPQFGPTRLPNKIRSSNSNSGGIILYIAPTRMYMTHPVTPKVWGLRMALLRMITTSTFYKVGETEQDYAIPCIVKHDSIIRTAARVSLRQKAFLKTLKTVIETISFESIIDIIKNKVEPDIIYKTITNKAVNSIYYHYWIDRAYSFFSNPMNRKNILSEIDRKIGLIDKFLRNKDYYINHDIIQWTYNRLKYIFAETVYLKEFSKDNSNENFRISEFMYMYLNVLYEYRKYFIYKRANKVDGTYWLLRELEGVIPSMTQQIKSMKIDNDPDQKSALFSGTHKYKVNFYQVQNLNSEKVNAAVTGNGLERDRIQKIYIKVNYIPEVKAKEYLDAVINDSWNEEKDGRYIYVPEKDRWAELPFDDLYRLISRKYLKTLKDKKYNDKLEKIAKKNNTTQEYLFIDPNIDGISNNKCVFYIKWSDGYGGLSNIQTMKDNGFTRYAKSTNVKGQKTMNKGVSKGGLPIVGNSPLDMYNEFPYVYRKPDTWNVNGNSRPKILFDINSGVDLNKIKDFTKIVGGLDKVTPQEAICNIQETSDYWEIQMPSNVMPLAVGYQEDLKIISERTSFPEVETPITDEVATATGSFGYSLYPIIEEQANTIPGIGLSMQEISNRLKDGL